MLVGSADALLFDFMIFLELLLNEFSTLRVLQNAVNELKGFLNEFADAHPLPDSARIDIVVETEYFAQLDDIDVEILVLLAVEDQVFDLDLQLLATHYSEDL